MQLHHHLRAPTLAAIACASALALAALPARAQVDLVANGSLQSSSSRPVGWSFIGGGEYFGIEDLDSSLRVNAGGITQNISGLQVGQRDALSFRSLGDQTNWDPDARQQWRVSCGDQTGFGEQSFANPTANRVQSRLTFTASAATQALTFVAEFLPGPCREIPSTGGILPIAAAVSGQAPPWLLGAGLPGIGSMVRRRLR